MGYWEDRDAHEQEMREEVERVMALMDDMGYKYCDHVDYGYSEQYVKVETLCDRCRIIEHIWAIPEKAQFKNVLKWFFENTKFRQVVGIMRGRVVPTFFSAEDVEKTYSRYFE